MVELSENGKMSYTICKTQYRKWLTKKLIQGMLNIFYSGRGQLPPPLIAEMSVKSFFYALP